MLWRIWSLSFGGGETHVCIDLHQVDVDQFKHAQEIEPTVVCRRMFSSTTTTGPFVASQNAGSMRSNPPARIGLSFAFLLTLHFQR